MNNIGFATILRDRFVAMVSERLIEEGVIELVPMRYTQDKNLLNAEVGIAGSIEAEVADFGGNIIKGFSHKDVIALKGNSRSHEILVQKDGKTYGLPIEYKGQPVRLRL